MRSPLVLGFSPHLPVSVCGTGASPLDSSFSRQCGITRFGTCISLPVTPWTLVARTLLRHILSASTRSSSRVLELSPCVPASLMQEAAVQECLPVLHRLRLSAWP